MTWPLDPQRQTSAGCAGRTGLDEWRVWRGLGSEPAGGAGYPSRLEIYDRK